MQGKWGDKMERIHLSPLHETVPECYELRVTTWNQEIDVRYGKVNSLRIRDFRNNLFSALLQRAFTLSIHI